MRHNAPFIVVCSLLELVLSLSVVVAWNQARAGGPTRADEELLTLQGAALGTTYTVRIVFREAHPSSHELRADVEAVLARIDRQMSLWRDDSELSRFNALQSTDWFDVSPATAEVVSAALEVGRFSEGAFDPTVSPLVRLWNFGPDGGAPRVPTADELAGAQALVGVELLEVRLSPPAIRKLRPEVSLDLNGIAKGYAVDCVVGELRTYDPLGLMVEIGGEVRVVGTRPDGSPWRIGIERPVIDRRELDSVLELTDLALATSGDYRNYFEAGGVRYSHTIDPRTGAPVRHGLASVSVLADDCMTADAWATALMVLGPDAGFSLATEREIRALFLVRDATGHQALATAGFPDLQPAPSAASRESPLTTFLLTAALFGLAIAGMAIGVMLSKRRLQGTCGGLAGLKDAKGHPLCEACTNPAEDCAEFRRQVTSRTASSDAGTPLVSRDDA